MLSNQNFISEINKIFLYKKNFSEKIGVAVSGGLDSMVLFDLLLKKYISSNLEVLHCNFNLRGIESNKDEIFVKNFCKKKNIVCHVKRFNTMDFSKQKKISIQMSARELRYDWFNQLLKKKLYQFIALGHHLDDSIETFFINILRGTGIKGLLGIPKKNNHFIRPLSNFNKKDLLCYASLNQIQWRLDNSNYTQKYLRNKIRIHLSSMIHTVSNSSFYKGFKKTINLLYEENFLIEQKIKEIHDKITIEKKKKKTFFMENK